MSEPTAASPPVAEAARRAGAAPTAELLDTVRAEGGRRRRTRQRRRTGALALAAVLSVGVPLAVLSGGDGGSRDEELVAASDPEPVDDDGDDDGDDTDGVGDFADERRELGPTAAVTPTTIPVVPPTSSIPTTVTAAPAGDADDPDPTPTTSPPLPRRPTPSVTTTTAPPPPAPVCRNSTDPACGPFRYDPVPTNAPLLLSATTGTATVAVGQEVVIEVTWSDADASLFSTGVDWGDGGLAPAFNCLRVGERFGPWDPPPPAGGSGTYTERHAYEAAGTYTVSPMALSTRTSAHACDDPYFNFAGTSLTITVIAAAD